MEGMVTMRILCLLSEGFEDLEAVGTVALLRRAGLSVDYASVYGDNRKALEGSYGTMVMPDRRMESIDIDDYDGLFVPGGPHAKNLRDDENVLSLVRRFHEANKWMAAICAAPSVFGRAGIMDGVRYISFPGTESYLPHAKRMPDSVVCDGKVITGKGAGVVIEFALAIIEALLGKDKAGDVKHRIQYMKDEEK